jgi:hypothetical protein
MKAPRPWQPEDVPAAGEWLSGMPNELYHGGPGISSSAIKAFLVSPRRFRLRAELPKTKDQELGTLRHLLCFEPEQFGAHYHVVPDDMRRDKRTQAYQAELEVAGSRTILKEQEVKEARAFAEGVRAHPWMAGVLARAARTWVETSFWWTSDPSGLLCKARPDVLLDLGEDDPLLCIDLKSRRSAARRAVQRDGEFDNWHTTAALYCDGIRAVTGRRVDWVAMVCEYTPPYEGAPYLLSVGGSKTEAYAAGRTKYMDALARLAQCEAADNWPGLNNDALERFNLSRWELEAVEDLPILPEDEEPF